MTFVADIIGALGAFLIILAYFMQQCERWTVDALAYQLANLLGAGAILVSLYWAWNLPQFVLEVVWFAISMLGLINYVRTKQESEP